MFLGHIHCCYFAILQQLVQYLPCVYGHTLFTFLLSSLYCIVTPCVRLPICCTWSVFNYYMLNCCSLYSIACQNCITLPCIHSPVHFIAILYVLYSNKNGRPKPIKACPLVNFIRLNGQLTRALLIHATMAATSPATSTK